MGRCDTLTEGLAPDVHNRYHGDMSEEIPSYRFRNDMHDVLNRVQHDGEHIPVTRYRQTSAFIVPPDWYERAAALMAEHEQNRGNQR